MRILRRKSKDVKPAIAHVEKQYGKVEFTREMGKSLTTLDFIGLVVLTMFLPALLAGQRIDEDNPRERVDKD